MSARIDKSWVVFDSIETGDGTRCIDLFFRPDGTYGFEEFRRDPEDGGAWTPVHYFSGKAFARKDDALDAALHAVAWLADALRDRSV
ncbi:MAG TPA: hypothetical protein VFP74_12840 [Pseudolabrys sp.]|nr:hypothetical protein [Pseudolabrys sp.]